MNTSNETLEMARKTSTVLNNAKQELDKLIIGEGLAKITAIGSIILRQNYGLFGIPGTGKSEIVSNSWRLVEDLSIPENVTILQASTKTNETNLFGTVTVQPNGETFETDGSITKDTVYVAVPEANRMIPYVWNSLMEVLAQGYFIKLGGNEVEHLENLRSFAVAGNLQGGGEGTFLLGDALMSRLGQTVFPGGKIGPENDTKVRNDDHRPKPESIKHVMSIKEANDIDDFIYSDFRLNDAQNINLANLERKARDVLLKRWNYDEGPRLTGQLGRLARFLLLANDLDYNEFQYTPESSESVGIVAARLVLSSRIANKVGPSRRHSDTPEVLLEEIIAEIKK